MASDIHGPATEKLYWLKPYDKKFQARVLRSWQEGPDETLLVLDATLFYPEGGGQPCDLGRITVENPGGGEHSSRLPENGFDTVSLEVTRVFESEGEVIHAVKADSSGGRNLSSFCATLTGAPVTGEIDWTRRFDHMQQHTGQHILSRAFEELIEARTVGFHMARDYVSIDLDVKSVSPAQVVQVEDLANCMIFRNLKVTTREFPREDVPQSIRQRFTVDSPSIRVVSIGDFDSCACGGTHVASTGEIGLIKVTGLDRAHGGVRVFFSCGWRALSDFRAKEGVLLEASALISRAPSGIPEVLRSLLSRVSQLEKERQELRREIMGMEIERILEEDRRGQAGVDAKANLSPAVVRAFPGKEPGELRFIAQKISEGTGKPCVVFSREPSFALVAAMPGSQGSSREGREGPSGGAVGPFPLDARVLTSKIGEKLGGRGGGNARIAQIGLKEPLGLTDDEIISAIKSCYGVISSDSEAKKGIRH